MKARTKLIIENLLSLIPFGRDFYLVMTARRRNISFRKLFDDYEQAVIAVKANNANSYEDVHRNKAAKVDAQRKQLDVWHFDRDYPLGFWLSTVLKGSGSVLELGGGLGNFYYAFKKIIGLPESLKWIVAELPAAVELGKKLAIERNEQQIEFVTSESIDKVDDASIFICSGTIQYLPENLAQILNRLKTKPLHVFLHYTPVHPNKEYWTLQQLPYCVIPYKISSEVDLIESMHQYGYKLVQSWIDERSIEIPFHRSITIDGFKGYYFILSNQE